MSISEFVLVVNAFVLCYFLVLNGIYLLLYVISFFEIVDYSRREIFSGLSELFTSAYAPPVSLIVPAYNEEATIADSVRSFLALRYPRHQVVVVNDGSRDRTMEVLKREFDLWESDQPIRLRLRTAPIKGVYASSKYPNLLVIDKENGGKADSLNAGICAASYPLVCCIDADIILEEDALLRVARPMIESSDVVAVGGIVRVANGCKVETGRVVDVRAPKEALPTFQVVEYLRAFLAARTAWSRLNCLLIISGAFGMFRREDLISVGGYETSTVGEDMEVVTRMHRLLRERNRRYHVSFVPDPVAWTEVPATFRVLRRQRDRWHRGLIDTLWRHKKMLLNPGYGLIGMLAMPYYFLFEMLGPVVELVGYLALVVGLLLGIVNLPFAIAFFAAAIGLGVLMSTAAVLLEEFRFRRYAHWRDLFKLLLFGVLENFGYRQLTTAWRAWAVVSYLRKDSSWGAMERRGFSIAQKS